MSDSTKKNTTGNIDTGGSHYVGQPAGMPSSLLQYYDNINEFPLMTAAEEAAVWEEIEGMSLKVRKELSHFLFVVEEHEKLVDECDCEAKVFECFCESRLTDEERKDRSLVMRNLPEWKAQLRNLRERMQTAYLKGKLSDKKRSALYEESFQLLSRFPAAREKIGEWCFVAEFYIDHGMDLQTASHGIRLTDRPEEDKAGVKMIRDTIEHYYDLRSHFVSSNLRLVLGVVNKFNISYQQHPDLIQEGNLGLMLAFDKFDSRLGHKFSTYASWWIRRNITNAIPTQLRTIQIPPKMYQTLLQIRTAEEKIFASKGDEPTIEELAAELQMSTAKVHSLKMMMAQPLSLQTNIHGDEEGWTPEDFLSDEESSNPERTMTMQTMREDLYEAMKILSEREQLILRYHFGLNGRTPLKTQELSEMLGIPKEKLRRIERYALAKLRRKVADMYDEYK